MATPAREPGGAVTGIRPRPAGGAGTRRPGPDRVRVPPVCRVSLAAGALCRAGPRPSLGPGEPPGPPEPGWGLSRRVARGPALREQCRCR
eukprot:265609-Hanusia_phi.AAC.1